MKVLKLVDKKTFNALKEPLAKMLCDSFYLDPFYQAVMPDSHKRKSQITWWMKILIRYSFKYGCIYYDSELRGAVLWVGKTKPYLNDLVLAFMGMIFYPIKVGLKPALKMFQITSKWAKIHKQIKLPHYYLMVIGVHPDFQKEGIGSNLLNPLLNEADQNKLICYLETAKKENADFYQKNGFHVIYKESMNQLKYWIMERAPKQNLG